jgi:hypothetical protein
MAGRENMSISEFVRSATLSYMAICGNRYAQGQLARGTWVWIRELRERGAGVITRVFG